MKCHNCKGQTFERRTVDVVTRVGEHKVSDRSVMRPVCTRCGEFTVPANTLQKVELRAVVTAFKEAPRVTGAMLRFARHVLGLKQQELAERIGTSAESVSRWEREERPMEAWVPLTVLALVQEQLLPPHDDVGLMAG